jgi:hypothetical protein
MVHCTHQRTAHLYRAEISEPQTRLQLLVSQDMALIGREELLAGSIFAQRTTRSLLRVDHPAPNTTPLHRRP